MKNTTTTLNAIQEHALNTTSWNKLLTSLRKTKADDDPISLKYILETLGIKDAIWCLRCFDYKDYCLFIADVAESVLPIFKKRHPENQGPESVILGIRKYHKGEISIDDLTQLKISVTGVAVYDAFSAASAAADAYAAAHAYYVYTASDASASAASAAFRDKQWEVISELYVRHFC